MTITDQPMTITCPSWCTSTDHDEIAPLPERWHSSDSVCVDVMSEPPYRDVDGNWRDSYLVLSLSPHVQPPRGDRRPGGDEQGRHGSHDPTQRRRSYGARGSPGPVGRGGAVMTTDPLAILYDLDVQVAWCQSMPWQVLWLPEERVLVLNAQEPRARLAVEALKMVTPDVVAPL